MKTKRIAATAALLLIALLAGIYFFLHQTKADAAFIHPPNPKSDIPYHQYTIDNGKGDTIHYPSGSSIVMPPNAFLDKSGSPVKGPVSVQYREFHDQIDLFLSGIPMIYDSGGVKYNFESAGMCDFNATQKGQALTINPAAQPIISMMSNSTDNNFSLYYLDTVKRQWINAGKASITTLSSNSETIPCENNSVSIEMPIAPVKPEKITGDMPVIKVAIDSSAYAELKYLDNIQFQLDKNETRFNPEDANIEWSDFRLANRSKNGLYEITFSNKSTTKSYLAKPVLNEKDFAKGIRSYEKKRKIYEIERAKRLKIQEAERKEQEEYNKKLVKQIEQRNKENEIIREKNKQIRKQNIQDMKMALRVFSITGTGVWNCDRPIPDVITSRFFVLADFIDEDKKAIKLNNVNVIHRSLFGLIPNKDNSIGLAPNDDNMIIAMYEDRFYYIDYEHIKAMNLSAKVKSAVFQMKKLEDENFNGNYIKNLVAQK